MNPEKTVSDLASRGMFFIPIGESYGFAAGDFYLCYVPVTRSMQVIDGKFFRDHIQADSPLLPEGDPRQELPSVLPEFPVISDPGEVDVLYFILTYRCNFKCVYCYSAEGRSAEEITYPEVETMLKYFLSPEKKGRKIAVNFIGGGEPMLARELLQHSIEMIRQLEELYGLEVSIGIITNGSVLDDEICGILKKHDVQLKISFEVLPEIQNLQRGNFDLVSGNIKKYSPEIPTIIRSVITADNVELIPDMVEELLHNYPHVKQLKCDPVVIPDGFGSPEDAEEFYLAYGRSFIKAMKLCRGTGLELSCWVTRVLNRNAAAFCPPVFTVTPQGSITSCVCYSSPKENGYPEKIFGSIRNGAVSIDPAAWKRLCERTYAGFPECENCFMKYHCAGGCLAHRAVYPPEINLAICRAVRKMAKNILLDKLEQELKTQYGLDLYGLLSGKGEN